MNPVREWREDKQLSRGELALLCGISYPQVQTTETGLVGRPHRKILEIIADADGPVVSDQIAEKYRVWRARQGEQLRTTLISR